MKSILLLLLPCILFAANLNQNYHAFYFGNELTGIYSNQSLDYITYDLDPNYNSNTMVDVIRNTTNDFFFDPSPEFKDLGCDRKLHIMNGERFYCTDQTNQLLLAISSTFPWTVVETYFIGFSNTNFYDWIDSDTQYIVFVAYLEWPSLWNFTVFNTNNNQFFSPIIINTTELLGEENFTIEGYFITEDIIGFGIEDVNNERPTQIWQSELAGTQQKSQISTANVTYIHRIIVLSYANIIYIHESNIYTTEISSGSINTYALDSTINDINKINHTHFTVSSGSQISMFTVNENNQLVQTASVDLSEYLQINNYTLNPPDCCAGQGFLQAWVSKPQQNSYFMLDQDTLEIQDYTTPYTSDASDSLYYPSFYLGNGSLVRPTYDGYTIMNSAGNFSGFVPVPLQDVYFDPSNDDFVYGFFSGATKDYPHITSCYLLIIQKSESTFTTLNLPHCPNPTQNSSLYLLDVQCDSSLTSCNLTYQALNGIYVIADNTPYLIESKITQFGNTFAFPQYSASEVVLIGQIPDIGSTMGQIVYDSYNFITGTQITSKVLSAFGTVAKVDSSTAMYSYSYLVQTTITIYNTTAGSSTSTNNVNEPLVTTLIPLNGGQSLVTMNPAGAVTLYQPNEGQLSGSNVNFNRVGTVFLQPSGQNSFIVLTYCSGLQGLSLFSFSNQTVIEI